MRESVVVTSPDTTNSDSNWSSISAQRAAIINQQQEQSQARQAEKVSFQQVLTAFRSQERSFATELRTASSPGPDEQDAEFDSSELRALPHTSNSDGKPSTNSDAASAKASSEDLRNDKSAKNSESEHSPNGSSRVANLSPLQILLSRGIPSVQQGQTGEGRPEARLKDRQALRENATKPNDGIHWAAKPAIQGRTSQGPTETVRESAAKASIQDANTIPAILPNDEPKKPLTKPDEQLEAGKVESLRRTNPLEGGTLSTSVSKTNVNRPPNASLAFAVRLTSDEDADSPEKPENPALSQDTPITDIKTAHSFSLELGPESRDAARSANHSEENLSVAALFDNSTQDRDGETTVSNAQTSPTDNLELPGPLESEPSGLDGEPVRNVNFQISGSRNQRVDIRLLEIGGEMRVSVRSTDTGLARSLQDRIPELTTRLDQEHFRSEVWIPKTIAPAEQGHANGKPGQDEPSSDPDSQGKQRNRREQEQPDWVDELETRPRGAKP